MCLVDIRKETNHASSAMMFETFNLSHRNGVATLTLNRPERLNAYSSQMRVEMLEALDLTR